MKLGQTLTDRVSGFTGIAVCTSNFLTGNVQFTLQQRVNKDGSIPVEQSFDVHQLTVADKQIGEVHPVLKPPDTGIKLGEKVQDIVTKFSGIVAREVTFLNGCVYYVVQSELGKDGKVSEDFAEWKRLKRVGPGVSNIIAKKVATTTLAPGGPSFRIPARR